MFEFRFLSNPLCHRPPQLPKQPYPLQHLLPPDTSLLKQTKQSLRVQQDTTVLNKKIEQAKQLAEKNEQLIAIINQKQTERSRINKKYNELMIMYEEIKNNGATLGMEITTQNLVEDNRVLLEKNRKLEREIIQAEKELIRKTKFYEEKNEDSRKLLQKLNQNITKREQKFKSELSQAQSELRKKSEALSKLQQQYHYLQSIHNQKQDQLTKILQQTQRDRSAFSQNISTIESKLQTENNKLNQDLISMKIMVQKVKNQNIDRINQLEEICHRLEQENQVLRRQYEQAGMYIEQVNSKGVDLDIECKELENRCKLLQIQVEQLKTKLNKKTIQYTNQVKKTKTLTQHNQQLEQRIKSLQEQLQNISHTHQQSKSQSQILGLQVQKLNRVLEQKIGYITDLQIRIQEENKMRVLAQKQCQKLEGANKQVSSLSSSMGKKIVDLEELLEGYKGERVRVRREADVKWKEMTDFYEKQIEKLNGKLLSMQAKTSNSKLSPSRAINLLTNESEY